MTALDRKTARLLTLEEAARDTGYMEGTMAERLAVVWELTESAWASIPNSHAEQRLQRDVAVLTRRER